MDESTRRSLELIRGASLTRPRALRSPAVTSAAADEVEEDEVFDVVRDSSVSGSSLLSAVDRTLTAGGGRLLAVRACVNMVAVRR